MSLQEKQAEFARCLGLLLCWINTRIISHGWAVTLAEGYVNASRRVRLPAGNTATYPDATHMRDSLHYIRLAQDLNLFVNGKLVRDGSDPAWLT
jgi:hypothetical protein